MEIFIAAIAVFALAMLGMSVGAILTNGRRCIRGTCGGEEVVGPNGEDLLCDACPRRDELESPQ